MKAFMEARSNRNKEKSINTANEGMFGIMEQDN